MKATISLCLSALLLAGCEKTIDSPRADDKTPRPSLVFEGFQAFGSRGELLQWQAWADRAEVYNEAQKALVDNIRVHYFQDEKVVSVLTADKGEIDSATHDVQAVGHVRLEGKNGIVLTTDRLSWDHASESIHTDSRVRVEQKDRILTGRGLKSDRNLERVKVLHDVNIEARSLKSLREARDDFSDR